MARKTKTPAIAYMRTSSRAGVGDDKDSQDRQITAIKRYAARAGYELVAEFYDAAVNGSDNIQLRPEFTRMMEYVAAHDAKTVIVETANRFARDLIVQETGYEMLKATGITLIATDSPDSFVDDGPTAVLIRQILGAVAQFDKAMLVQKLRSGRERANKAAGRRLDVRRSVAELYPQAMIRAKYLHRYRRLSLRKISAALASEGLLSKQGKPFAAKIVKSLVEARLFNAPSDDNHVA